MKSNWFKSTGAVAVMLAAAAAACSAGDIDAADPALDGVEGDDEYALDDVIDQSFELGSTQQGLMSCANPDGANSVMAALAVAAAQDMGRWQANKDFVVFGTSGRSEASAGQQQAIKLTSGSDASGPKGKSRCADGVCARVQAILDMQYDQANDKIFLQGSGNKKVLLSPGALRSRLVAKLGEQRQCDAAPRDGNASACPVEEHKLTFQSSSPGSCDTNFYFLATKPDGRPLLYPNQLKNKLKFADQVNPYISFQNLGGGVVSIDPTYGLNVDASSSAGSCTAACTKISTTNVAGQCCSCGGATKKFAKSAWSSVTFLCQ